MRRINDTMMEYLIRGMREEKEKDTIANPNENVRVHKSKPQETNRAVAIWSKCVEIGDEKHADEYYCVLKGLFNWWRNYFDVSPEYARECQTALYREMAKALQNKPVAATLEERFENACERARKGDKE